ncbi:ribonuclease Z [Aurantibacter sp.]|uniref:ribonuclease Z n=1 Tax=Aurantibacter sp. TaxID=2807103 RepID=UPI003267F444
MIFDKKDNTTTVFQENISLAEFLKNLKEAYPKIKDDHLIINLFSFSALTADDILEFLQISNEHRALNKSFVLVTAKVSYDDAPEEICVVPTIREAHDFIEMEEIERDLDL